MDRAINVQGASKLVALLRLSPAIPFMPATALLALTNVNPFAFTLGTSIGLIPFAFVYALMGSAGRQLLTGGFRNPATLSLAVFGLVTTIALTAYINGVASAALAEVHG